MKANVIILSNSSLQSVESSRSVCMRNGICQKTKLNFQYQASFCFDQLYSNWIEMS